jgi:prevent-host-death family protein
VQGPLSLKIWDETRSLGTSFPSHSSPDLDNQPSRWFIQAMKSVGIFEAKTHFPGICDEIVASGTPITISRRGKPLVVISPVPAESQSEREDILAATARWQADAGTDGGDFPDVWEERSSSTDNPLRP